MVKCPDCGGSLKQEITETGGSNRTKTRYVGGRNMGTKRVCRVCGSKWTAKELIDDG